MSTLNVENISDGTDTTATANVVNGSAKAWVNFDGTSNTGGNCDIRESYNVSTVADNGTASYTVNFATALADANYSAAGVCYNPGSPSSMIAPCSDTSGVEVAPTANAFRFSAIQRDGSTNDTKFTFIAVFR